MACVSKIGSLYEMVTKNVIVSTTNTVFGINPRAWIALPCEGLILLKIRQVVPTAGSALPVQIAVPANSTVSTVGADTCCPVTGVNVVNPINVAVTGAAMVNGTERLLYFKKAFERARRGKDISSFERQEKESGFNFLHNPNNGRMQSGHIIIDGIGLFKQIIHER